MIFKGATSLLFLSPPTSRVLFSVSPSPLSLPLISKDGKYVLSPPNLWLVFLWLRDPSSVKGSRPFFPSLSSMDCFFPSFSTEGVLVALPLPPWGEISIPFSVSAGGLFLLRTFTLSFFFFPAGGVIPFFLFSFSRRGRRFFFSLQRIRTLPISL